MAKSLEEQQAKRRRDADAAHTYQAGRGDIQRRFPCVSCGRPQSASVHHRHDCAREDA